ncbi:MAG: hypothetical protein WBP93_23435, partial [Pyrinomonadaceae bacterium]
MYSTSIVHFCKQATCPTSEALLAYREARDAAEQGAWIESHLSACDFCGAEFQLLAEHAAVERESDALTVMPPNLRRLAESLLTGAMLEKMFGDAAYEKEGLTLT